MLRSFVGLLGLLLTCPTLTQSQVLQGQLPEVTSNDIGYKTVAAALAGLKAKSGVLITIEHGWTIVTEIEQKTLWSFAPPTHPAYPSVVQRRVEQVGENVVMHMAVTCEASKTACDGLVREFSALNEAVMPTTQPRRD